MASDTLLPHMILSKLEDSKRNHLLPELRALSNRRDMLETKLEASTLRYKEIEKRRYGSCRKRIKASEIAALEEARQEEASLKNSLSGQLLTLKEEEKKIKRKMLASMNISRACGSIEDKEQQLQKKISVHTEQQSIDDMMAHRCTQGTVRNEP